ncbi:hypothetical protein CLCR_11328 [Cladophialophora carrionii]|uniref:Phytanoyl-CoA dioxygenase n=1 Tax=Cladophialophora carrionii TaxID=86049 RepID=A0A1C1CKB8_9EURO|nr:hypothetical protein CLCR_11328 [Cladophialophora carrionii]
MAPSTGSTGYKVLTPDQVSHFMQHGYVVIEQCFSKEASDEWTKDVWTRLGIRPCGHDDVPDFAPKAWDAICDLVGGEDRVTEMSKAE